MSNDLRMVLDHFDYFLPEKMIAQKPAKPRDASKLMVIERATNKIHHDLFRDLPKWLTSNDVLVINETKVLPARLWGKKRTGGKMEFLLLEEKSINRWHVLTKPGLKTGEEVEFAMGVKARAEGEQNEQGEITVVFELRGKDIKSMLVELGTTPIPPYIRSDLPETELRQVYQTIYARNPGSVAAPTAGLHFTRRLLERIRAMGVNVVTVDLHVGGGTFLPVTQTNLDRHQLHQEMFSVPPETAEAIEQAKREGKRVVAVGTTTIRALESASREIGERLGIHSGLQTTQLFIQPPFHFNVVDCLITNFHLPKSSLLMLVSAFVSWPQTTAPFTSFDMSLMGRAYDEAKRHDYRFYSFGDASIII